MNQNVHNSKIESPLLLQVVLGVVFCIAIFQLGTTSQTDFNLIVSYSGLAFLIYILFHFQKAGLTTVFAIGLAARLLLVFLFPTLSDDIYRFIWDGRLTAAGYNPYSHLPCDLTLLEYSIPGINADLYNELNSPRYYTIYPPISQFIFWLCSFWTDDIRVSSVSMKFIFLIAELFTLGGLLKMLKYLKIPATAVGLYWLNPLIIIEGVGNLHFEIVTIAFLIWGLYYFFIKQGMKLSATLIACSVATKMLPLIFLPYFFFRMKGRDRIKFFVSFSLVSFFLFIPIFLGVQLLNFGSSVDLYFQKFEFNGSIYYLLRYLGQIISGYNLIYYLGPLLGLTTLFLIIRKAQNSIEVNLKGFIQFGLFAFSVYLLFATTVHPWYLCIPIVLSVFTDRKYAILWSFLIVLTYVNYSFTPYHESLWVVGLEYILLASFIYIEHKQLLLAKP